MTQNKNQELQKKIDSLKLAPLLKNPNEPSGNMAFNVAIELLASTLTGLIIGLALDNLFHSKPVCLIISLLLSVAASFRIIWTKYI